MRRKSKKPTSTERVKAHQARKRELGLRRFEFWLMPYELAEVTQFVQYLERKRRG